ncbi:chorismate synthase [Candidatus Soleaferrea massiliensis]|uniref:chorismate synthase n=1 Tax=Candidatus Soleaferrea massiliensis TaxID=1470354 RepID=UPI0005912D93|nr:chorismate synthase [Candidatus Soleaferrea massiliensis]
MSSMWGEKLKLSVFGESHGGGIGVVIDGLQPGEKIDLEELRRFTSRRTAKKEDRLSTARAEQDLPKILSGLVDGVTTGTPLCAVIENTDTKSGDYKEMQQLARPGHADYTGHLRYRGYNDIRGGGHFSGRLTAPLVFAGGVCKQILERRGISVGAHISSVKDVADRPFDPVNLTPEELLGPGEKPFPVIDDQQGERMRVEIEKARLDMDSVGGIIECAAVGFPAGVGSPIYDGLENVISGIVFSIPAVKGIEFGLGFEAARLFGSQNNDAFYNDGGTVKTRTNHHGGILGGISSGMPIIFRAAFKPTPSIGKEQDTVSFVTGEEQKLSVKGRHDPCIVPRAVPCVEAAMAIALLSQLIS